VVPHIRLGPIQQALELQAIRISVRYHIAHLAHNGGEDKNTNQIANDRKNISAREQFGEWQSISRAQNRTKCRGERGWFNSIREAFS